MKTEDLLRLLFEKHPNGILEMVEDDYDGFRFKLSIKDDPNTSFFGDSIYDLLMISVNYTREPE